MTDDFTRAWRDWHEHREAALAQPHGWLSLTAFHWLDEEPAPLDGLPGLWSSDGTAVTVTAKAADGLSADGRAVDGTVEFKAPAGSGPAWVDYGDKRLELAPRGGRHAVRVRDPLAPTRTGFTGVPAFDPDPAWVVRAEFTPAPELVDVGSVREGVDQSLHAVGTVRFDLGGAAQELVATDAGEGRLWLLFRDPTNGDTTSSFRQLTASAPDPDGTVELDFNRSLNMPCAFTDYGTCPLPPGANRLTAAVTAGERKPS
ncbi:DUF1684 domain-containing protein [Glycomyces artemisiae]|uniref:DUF1684 domain-containing protein n=1 Tax=Glycomyces artemisiae TaxID=1076443 RepID=A0A2T0UG06_9ACTN|nr:DUF1684 domain-containing protein [Glycomyces artemisiae]PRY56804.1 hypothetical protein B0I28_108115 [Glycomyces artemisiae]